MKKELVVVLALFLVLLVSCSTVKETPDQETQGEVQQETESDELVKDAETEQSSKLSPEIKELLDKGRKIDNYKFLAETSKLDNDVYVQRDYKLLRKGNLMRKTLIHSLSVAGKPYTDIISNLDDRTSIGICLVLGVTCEKNYLKIISVEYDDFSGYTTPYTLIEQVPGTAVVARKSLIEQRQSLVLEYDEAGNRVELSVDTYYGLPLKKEVFRTEDKKVLETITFKNLIVNGVKDSDVVFT